MNILTKYFFNGLLFLTPIIVTLYILYLIVSTVDQIFGVDIPGLGFLITIPLVTAIGFLVSTFLARGAARFIDRLFCRMPIVRMIYSAIKDLVNAFVGEKKRFDRPVLVNISPESTVRIIGFVTRESLENIGMADSMAVYIPQSYNFAGNLIVVPKEQVIPLEVESGKVMTFIVSGGVSGF
ncbi:MAG: DUF502 domain-containing protein [Nitrospirae bacterium]|jgi:uncharacterized membrane protein|nr:DUF502 domain-containing protein [Nitrospirota bacterium]